MEHTFLFAEADWHAEGTYLSEEGETLSARGSSTVSHREDVWIADGGLDVQTEDGPIEFRSTYRIRPFTEGDRVTTWTAENPALGLLQGVFVVMEDTILSQYQAGEGGVAGAETLRQIRDWEYEARGLLRLGKDRFTAWALRVIGVA